MEGSAREGATMWEMVDQGRSFSGNERHCAFLNTGGGTADGDRFAVVSALSGLDYPDDGRATARVDWDHDGDIDLWISNRNAPRLRFLRNDVRGSNHFLSIRLRGDGVGTNRDAVGARVEVITSEPAELDSDQSTGNREQRSLQMIKSLRAGEGFLSQSSKWLHFGLGESALIEKVIVRWPGGGREEFTGLEANGRSVLVQHEGRAEQVKDREGRLRLAPSIPVLPGPEGMRRISLVNRVSLPKLTYLDFEGAARELEREKGASLLVNLWASWCGPCRIELKELTDRAAELRQSGLDVLALSVDGLGDDRSNPERARALLSEIGFPFTSGRATQNLVQLFQALHNLHIRGRQAPLPVPSSFLVGVDGNLVAIYKGALDIDGLIDDLKRKPGTLLERVERSAPFAGRVLEHDEILAALRSDESRIQFVFGTELQKAGLVDDAQMQYRELLKADPEFSLAHYNLGFLYLRQDKFPEARRHLIRAVELDPDHALSHKNLGRLYHMEGRSNEARVHYGHALRLQPNDPEPHYLFGIMAISEGDFDQAKVRLEDAVRIEPDLVQAHYNLGIISTRNGDRETAKSHFQKVLSLDPEFADAHINLGRVLMDEEKVQDAIAHYQQALRIDPNNPTARENLQRAQSMNLNQ